jgi:hypothetical protein
VLWKGSRRCRGESAKTGLGRAGAHVKEKMAGYREGGGRVNAETSLNTQGPSPMTRGMIATGAGLVAGMSLILARK